MDEATPEERLRAFITVQQEMLVDLWTFVLSEQPEPIEEAESAKRSMLARLEARLDEAARPGSGAGDEAAVTLAEAIWSIIADRVAALEGPTEIQPTAYGLRQWQAERKARDEDPGDAPDEVPD